MLTFVVRRLVWAVLLAAVITLFTFGLDYLFGKGVLTFFKS